MIDVNRRIRCDFQANLDFEVYARPFLSLQSAGLSPVLSCNFPRKSRFSFRLQQEEYHLRRNKYPFFKLHGIGYCRW